MRRRRFRFPRVPRTEAILRRRRARRLGAEPLEDRRMLAAAPLLPGESAYDHVAPAWFASAAALPPAAAPEGGDWIVRLSRDAVSGIASVADAAGFLGAVAPGLTVVKGLGLPGQLLVRGPSEVVATLGRVPGIASASPNGSVRLAAVPDDPSFGLLFNLNNTGQGGGKVGADINAVQAWDVSVGSTGTVVGVTDTGVEWTHPDLFRNIWTNPGEVAGNGLDDDANGFVDDVHGYDFVNDDSDPNDDHGHGTHVAGTIGAAGNNGTGVVGVNWDVSIMALKFIGGNGYGTDAGAIAAVNYATMMRSMYGVNVRVLNASWGDTAIDVGLRDAIAAAGGSGILFVAAAGNSAANADTSPFYPAALDLPNVVSVAATDSKDALASFSNYGAKSVDLGAPGVGIQSTVIGGRYGAMSGTSMASPHVAGAAALAAAVDPSLDVVALKGLLLSTTEAVTALAGKTVTGGRLDADALVRAAAARVAAPAVAGRVAEDFAGDGPDAGDRGVRGVTVYADTDGDGSFDAGEPSAVSDAAGRYAINGLGAGAVVLRATPSGGWTPAGSRSVTVVAGTTTVADVAVVRAGTILGRVIDDFDGDGVVSTSEKPLAGQKVYVDFDGDGVRDTGTLAVSSGAVAAAIVDRTTARSTIDVTGAPLSITDLDVTVNLAHTSIGDLTLRLVAPDGTPVLLARQRGGVGRAYTATVFDDEASTAIASGSAPFTGRFRPESPLAVFDGMATTGAWTLEVADDGPGDSGTLTSWSLSFATAEPLATTDAAGCFRFAPLPVGDQTVRLLPDAAFVATGSGGARTVTVSASDAARGAPFTVVPVGSIGGRVYDDADIDGVRDAGETGSAGVTAYVDGNSNGLLDTGEPTTKTDSEGLYRFTGRLAGTHPIRIVPPSGRGQTAPATGRHLVTLATGGVSFGNDFGLTAARAPTDIVLSPATIAENNAVGAVVGTLKATDPDAGDVHVFTLVEGDGSADNASFTIAGASLKAAVSFDFETRSSYSVRVRAVDQAGNAFEKSLAVAVSNVNESPTAVSLSPAAIVENAAVNTVVGTLSTADPDAGDTFTYALVAGTGSADNARFNVSGTSLRSSAVFDFETRSSYAVRIRSTDKGGKTFETPLTITIIDGNDAPMLGGIASSIEYVENGVIQPSSQGTVSDLDSFDFDGGKLTVSVAANGQATDRLELRNEGVGEGQVGVSGTVVTVGGVTVGAVAGGTSGSSPLVVTFNASATAGVVQTVLRAFQYRSTSDHPIPLTRTLRYVLTDGDGGTSALVNQVVNMTLVNDAPTVTGVAASVTYTENAVLLVAPSGTVADVDNATLSGGTLEVSIVANGQSNDRLSIRHQGTAAGQVGISGADVTYGGVVVGTFAGGETGTSPLVVTFNAKSSPSIASLILRNVTFTHSSDAPVTPLSRSVRYVATDGSGGTSDAALQTLTILPVNDIPVLGGIASSIEYVENGVIQPSIQGTVSDLDSFDFDGGKLTVSVAANGQSTDRLELRNEGVGEGQVGVSGTVVTVGGVTVGAVAGGTSGSSPLVVTFNASATAGVVQTVLRAFQYRSTSDNPIPLTRTLRYVLTDGDGGTSALVNQVVNMTLVNDAPTVTGVSASVTYTENAVLLVAPSGTVADVDNATLSGGTLEVSIVANGQSNDRLSIRHQGTAAGQVGISGADVTFGGVVVGTFAGGETGTSPLVVTFNAKSSPSIASAILRNVTFTHLSDAPVAPLSRSVRYVATDGSGGTSDAALQTLTILPVNDIPVLGGIASSIEYVENGVIQPSIQGTVSDLDSFDFDGGKLTVSVAANGQSTDRLELRNEGVGEGQVGVSGTVVTVGGVTVGSVAGGTSGSSPLVVTFNASATAGVVQTVLRAFQYRSTSDNPIPLTRTLRYVLTDGDGGTSAIVNQVVNMTLVNDAPTVTGVSASVTYTENAVLLVAPSGTVADVDNATLSGGTLEVSIVANGQSNDRLSIRHQGTAAGQVGISGADVTFGGVVVGTFAGGETGTSPLVVTFNAKSSPSIASAILRNVTFTHLSDAPVAPVSRSVRYVATDGSGGTSDAALQTLTILPVNDAPVLGGINASPVAYSVAAGPVLLAAAATVADPDSATFAGGTLSVAFSAGGQSTDRLSILVEGSDAGQIGLSGGSVTFGGVGIGTLSGGVGTTPLSVTFNASATAAAVQALLRRIAYASVAADPSSGGTAATRTVRYILSDAPTSSGGLATTVFQTISVGP